MENLEEIQLNKKQIDRIVLKLKGFIKRVEKAERELRDCERRAGVPVRELAPHAARDPRGRGASARSSRRSSAARPRSSRSSTASVRTAGRKIKRVEEEAEVPVRGAAPHLPDDQRGRAAGRARQDRAGRGQPAPRRLDREEVHQPRPAVPGPDPGGQHRPDEGGRQVRVQARLQVLDLRHLVDPAGDHPRHRRPGAHHPHPGAHDRDDQQAHPHQPLPGAGARPRADAGGDRREDGAAARQGPQGPQDRQGAHLARDADRRGGGLPPRRLHRGQDASCRRPTRSST